MFGVCNDIFWYMLDRSFNSNIESTLLILELGTIFEYNVLDSNANDFVGI
jgi:hypothetical protein